MAVEVGDAPMSVRTSVVAGDARGALTPPSSPRPCALCHSAYLAGSGQRVAVNRTGNEDLEKVLTKCLGGGSTTLCDATKACSWAYEV